jgi:D-alanyl-D-alanine carboxypeptidase-like protein
MADWTTMKLRLLHLGLLLAFLGPACTAARSPAPASPASFHTVVIHSSRDLPGDLGPMLAQVPGVQWARSATSGMVDLVTTSGGAQPLPPRVSGGVLPFTVSTFESFPATEDVVSAALARGEALLSAVSGEVLGLEAGDAITLRGGGKQVTLRVAAVTRDERASEHEAIIPFASARTLGISNVRQVIVSATQRALPSITTLARDLSYPAPTRVGSWEDIGTPEPGRILSLGEIKRAFGEFTFVPRGSRFLLPHPDWVAANIVESNVPLMGRIKCNRRILGPLNNAMRQLQAEGLASLVNEPAGCYSPRMQFGNVRALSRHSFGIAVDINPTQNPFGAPSRQDSRLVAIMRSWGFAWGGAWLVPDAMHFEYAPAELFGPKS